jgi:5'-nucleotidase/UDP-sugar diphosphatase
MKRASIFILVLLVAITGTYLYRKNNTIRKITILHTNDHHGHYWHGRHGDYGLAAQKTLVDKIRQEVESAGGSVLLLSGGDINTGVPSSDLQDAEPDFKGMSAIGYDAMVLGNHEFDNSLDVLIKQKEWASFPFLAANVVKKDSGKTLFDAYKIFNFGGLKIAVFGLITPDTPFLVTPSYVETLTFSDPIAVAKKLVPELRKQADLVIALSHLGYYEEGKHGSSAPGDVTLAKSVSGIDVIVGGHSHDKLPQAVVENGTAIVQAKEWGKYVGRLDLTISNGVVTVVDSKLIPINLKKKIKKDGKSVRVLIEEEIKEDPTMIALLNPYNEKGKAELNKVIGSTLDKFDGERDIVRAKETNLGNLIAMVQRLKIGADVGVMNSGGIRTSLPKGEITYNDVLKVQPFANSICRVTLTGTDLKKYIEIAVNKSAGSGGFAQFDNIQVTMDGESLTALMVGDSEVKDDQEYGLAINAFIASGGDGYMKVTDHPKFVDTGFIDADLLKEYIEKNSPLNPADFAPTNDVIRK